MPKPLSLPFDPIARADELWKQRWGTVPSMSAITSIMRAQQILLAEVDAVVKPYGLTFARYEALVLLTFSKAGELPMSKIGERLRCTPPRSPTPWTGWCASGLVAKRPNPNDGRGTLAVITDKGREVVEAATRDLMAMDFGLGCTTRRSAGRSSRCCGRCGWRRTTSRTDRRGGSGPGQDRPKTGGYARPHEKERADPLSRPGLRHRCPAGAAVPEHDRQVRPGRGRRRGLHPRHRHRARLAVRPLPGLRLRPGLQGEVAVGKLLWVLLAGTIPTAAFFVERKVSHEFAGRTEGTAPAPVRGVRLRRPSRRDPTAGRGRPRDVCSRACERSRACGCAASARTGTPWCGSYGVP